MGERDLIGEPCGAAGCLFLDRPRALNALSPGMVRAMHLALGAFASDSAPIPIVIAVEQHVADLAEAELETA
jgi:enoyl-CoA hydratase/carnithine racemase